MKRIAICLLAVAALGLAGAATAVADAFRVSMEVHEGGELLGAPVVVVREGTVASLEGEGPQGYRLAFSLETAELDRVRLDVVYESSARTQPLVLLVELGQTATADLEDLRLVFTVERANP
jgi:hypothetical protein